MKPRQVAKGVICPECGKKLSIAKHYDAEYEWFECPKCEGVFTYDEIEAASKPKVKAKGKKRAEVIDKEAEALAEFEKKQLVPVKADKGPQQHRDEISTREVVNIMADEIQDIYASLGFSLDEENARDKALILWRDAKLFGHATAREQTVDMKLCETHA